MATLLGNLPAPVNYVPEQDAMHAQDWQAPKKTPPPAYGKRQGFVPRTIEDFGDGGAFPEIHVAQVRLPQCHAALRHAAARRSLIPRDQPGSCAAPPR